VYQEQFLDVSKLYKFNFKWIKIDILLKFFRPDFLWGQGWHPLPTYPPTHWVFWVGGQLKKPRKTHFCVKIIDLFRKKIHIILGYSNFL
jgi:hypothetical protein